MRCAVKFLDFFFFFFWWGRKRVFGIIILYGSREVNCKYFGSREKLFFFSVSFIKIVQVFLFFKRDNAYS